MSRAYLVRVAESMRKHLRIADGITTRLELLPILGPEEMADLLAAELEKLGFERDGMLVRRVEDSGVTVDIDLTTAAVTIRLAAEQDLDLEVDLKRYADRDRDRPEDAEAALRQVAREQLQSAAAAGEKQLTAEVTEKLEQALRDLRAELDRASNRATAEALKIRAGQLGEIEEISEDPESGELTIRVRV